jgi:hypothetical protein
VSEASPAADASRGFALAFVLGLAASGLAFSAGQTWGHGQHGLALAYAGIATMILVFVAAASDLAEPPDTALENRG